MSTCATAAREISPWADKCKLPDVVALSSSIWPFTLILPLVAVNLAFPSPCKYTARVPTVPGLTVNAVAEITTSPLLMTLMSCCATSVVVDTEPSDCTRSTLIAATWSIVRASSSLINKPFARLLAVSVATWVSKALITEPVLPTPCVTFRRRLLATTSRAESPPSSTLPPSKLTLAEPALRWLTVIIFVALAEPDIGLAE